MKERVIALEKVATRDEYTRLQVMYSAKMKTLALYNEEPTAPHLRDMKAADAVFTETLEQIENAYTPSGDTKKLSSKLEVWNYLKEEGYDIGRSQFYKHCKDGLCRPDKSGEYSLAKVIKYARQYLRLAATGEKEQSKLERLQQEKLEREMERETVRLESEKLQLAQRQGKVIERDEFERAIVARSVALLSHLRHMAQKRADDYIEMVNGDGSRRADLIAAMHDDIESHVAVFAADIEFDIIFEKSE